MQIITTHNNTDFDALASMVAATILYPDAVSVLPDNVNPNVKNFLSIHKDVFNMFSSGEIDFANVDSLIVVDTNDWSRLGRMAKLLEKDNLEIILWDHHPHPGNISADSMVQEEMGANITLMLRTLREKNKGLTSMQATLFLAGLYEDTGNLTFPSTKAEDAYAAGFFLENNADINIINSFLSPAYGVRQKDILFQMVKKATRSKIRGYTISFNKMEIKGHVDGLAVVVRMYRELLNVDAAFGIFFNKDRGRCIVIGRGNVDGLHIGSILQGLGGGGHRRAGSAILKTAKADAVEEMISDIIRDNQQSFVKVSDLMSFPVYTVESDTSMEDVGGLLREKGCTGLPVTDGEKMVGIISRRDFKRVKKKSKLKDPVKAFMSTNIISTEPERSLMQAARLMVKYDVGRLPVIENGKIIGIVTRSDAMLYFYDLLPD